MRDWTSSVWALLRGTVGKCLLMRARPGQTSGQGGRRCQIRARRLSVDAEKREPSLTVGEEVVVDWSGMIRLWWVRSLWRDVRR